MILSKPIKRSFFDFLTFYLQSLYVHPIKTKSITSCTIASLGNLTSQLIAGNKRINYDSVIAFGLFGLLFGGPVPHFFYTTIESLFPSSGKFAVFMKLLIERFMYAPFYQMFSLYMLATFEGKTHDEALKQVNSLYWSVLQANWKYLSILQFINMSFVPPMFRVLWVNTVGFFWAIFLANKRRQEERKKGTS